MASNQRLLFFPIALQVGGALLLLPVTLAAHDTVTFDVYARDVADDPDHARAVRRVVDLHRHLRRPCRRDRPRRALLTAWLSGAFIRSISDGALRWWPGDGRVREARRHLPRHRRVAVLGLGIAAVNDYELPALVGSFALAVVLMFTDYAVVFEDRSIPDAIRRSLRIWRIRWREAFLTWITFIFVGDSSSRCSSSTITDSDGVFPGFLGALLLVVALPPTPATAC